MLKFAANLTMLFNELEFLDRFSAAAAAGFTGVEYQFPYAYEKMELASRLKAFGLTPVLHNLPAGDWDKGERGIAIFPDRIDEFRSGVTRAIDYAVALGCRQLNCLAGITPPLADPKILRSTFIRNLRFAATECEKAGLNLLIEAVNTRDVPGFFLNNTKQALEICDETGAANIFIQYDIYHMQIMEGDLAQTIGTNLHRAGHIQLADNPGRNEPGTGEINYNFLFNHLQKLGYSGWIGCEYKPKATTAEGMTWFSPYAARRAAA